MIDGMLDRHKRKLQRRIPQPAASTPNVVQGCCMAHAAGQAIQALSTTSRHRLRFTEPAAPEPSSGRRSPGFVRLDRATATGTIRSSGAIPQAWLARFGRTVTDHVLDAVEARLAGDGSTGSHVAVGGQRTRLDAAGAGDADPSPAYARYGGIDRGTFGLRDTESCSESRAMTGRELLNSSALLLRLSASEDGGASGGDAHMTAWGRAAASNFDGRDGTLALDGEVVTGFLGADWARDGLTAGLALSVSDGEGSYRQRSAPGDVESTVTAFHPYLGLALSGRFSVWAVAGYGEGEVTLTPEGQPGTTANLSYAMGAAGARSEVLRPEDGDGMSLALRGDARVTRTSSDAVEAPGRLAAAEADKWRLRISVEGARAFALKGGAAFTPAFEVGLRHDGGDAEIGTGLEIGGALAYADPGSGLSMKLRARSGGPCRGRLRGVRCVGLGRPRAGRGRAWTIAGPDAGIRRGLWRRRPAVGRRDRRARGPRGQ